MEADDRVAFDDAVRGLANGDFSRLEPRFDGDPGPPGRQPDIVRWHEQGRLGGEPGAVAEAFSCACFLGKTAVADYFLRHGVDPCGGSATGMNAFHWAVNRGQLDVVRLLIRHRSSCDVLSRYGGNVMDTAIWSAIHEPKPDHPAIIEALLASGARPSPGWPPTGRAEIDALLARVDPA